MKHIDYIPLSNIISGIKLLSVNDALSEAIEKLDEYGLETATLMITNNEYYASNISTLTEEQKHALISKLRPLIIYAQLSLKFSEVPQ